MEKATPPLGLGAVVFTEKQIDGAALLASAAAISELPDAFLSFLPDSQLGKMQNELREFTKTSLLFLLMEHFEGESAT